MFPPFSADNFSKSSVQIKNCNSHADYQNIPSLDLLRGLHPACSILSFCLLILNQENYYIVIYFLTFYNSFAVKAFLFQKFFVCLHFISRYFCPSYLRCTFKCFFGNCFCSQLSGFDYNCFQFLASTECIRTNL